MIMSQYKDIQKKKHFEASNYFKQYWLVLWIRHEVIHHHIHHQL